MAEHDPETASHEAIDDFFEPMAGEVPDDELDSLTTASGEKQRLVAKRRRAEQRLEERRLRDELGYYDLNLDDL